MEVRATARYSRLEVVEPGLERRQVALHAEQVLGIVNRAVVEAPLQAACPLADTAQLTLDSPAPLLCPLALRLGCSLGFAEALQLGVTAQSRLQGGDLGLEVGDLLVRLLQGEEEPPAGRGPLADLSPTGHAALPSRHRVRALRRSGRAGGAGMAFMSAALHGSGGISPRSADLPRPLIRLCEPSLCRAKPARKGCVPRSGLQGGVACGSRWVWTSPRRFIGRPL
jgi:hypothetical protein